jgi:hypothetical protein
MGFNSAFKRLTYSDCYENAHEPVQSKGNQYNFLLRTSWIKTSGAFKRTEFLNSLSRFFQLLQEATTQVKPPITLSKCLTHQSFHTKNPELLNASLRYTCKYQTHVALNSQSGGSRPIGCLLTDKQLNQGPKISKLLKLTNIISVISCYFFMIRLKMLYIFITKCSHLIFLCFRTRNIPKMLPSDFCGMYKGFCPNTAILLWLSHPLPWHLSVQAFLLYEHRP